MKNASRFMSLVIVFFLATGLVWAGGFGGGAGGCPVGGGGGAQGANGAPGAAGAAAGNGAQIPGNLIPQGQNGQNPLNGLGDFLKNLQNELLKKIRERLGLSGLGNCGGAAQGGNALGGGQIGGNPGLGGAAQPPQNPGGALGQNGQLLNGQVQQQSVANVLLQLQSGLLSKLKGLANGQAGAGGAGLGGLGNLPGGNAAPAANPPAGNGAGGNAAGGNAAGGNGLVPPANGGVLGPNPGGGIVFPPGPAGPIGNGQNYGIPPRPATTKPGVDGEEPASDGEPSDDSLQAPGGQRK